jgi:hypothetical protein
MPKYIVPVGLSPITRTLSEPKLTKPVVAVGCVMLACTSTVTRTPCVCGAISKKLLSASNVTTPGTSKPSISKICGGVLPGLAYNNAEGVFTFDIVTVAVPPPIPSTSVLNDETLLFVVLRPTEADVLNDATEEATLDDPLIALDTEVDNEATELLAPEIEVDVDVLRD